MTHAAQIVGSYFHTIRDHARPIKKIIHTQIYTETSIITLIANQSSLHFKDIPVNVASLTAVEGKINKQLFYIQARSIHPSTIPFNQPINQHFNKDCKVVGCKDSFRGFLLCIWSLWKPPVCLSSLCKNLIGIPAFPRRPESR